jgi:hypothetical protein
VHETGLLLSFFALPQQPKSIIKLINSALDDCNTQVLIQQTTTNNTYNNFALGLLKKLEASLGAWASREKVTLQ